MAMVMTRYGMRRLLEAALQGAPLDVRYGLYQSDTVLRIDMTLSDLMPCDFSGYSGLLPVLYWQVPENVGPDAVCVASLLTWTRAVGPVSNWVVGYYVVDGAGGLVWASDSDEGSTLLAAPGQTHSVVPAVRLGSLYQGETA